MCRVVDPIFIGSFQVTIAFEVQLTSELLREQVQQRHLLQIYISLFRSLLEEKASAFEPTDKACCLKEYLRVQLQGEILSEALVLQEAHDLLLKTLGNVVVHQIIPKEPKLRSLILLDLTQSSHQRCHRTSM